jgi:hypothetical protein
MAGRGAAPAGRFTQSLHPGGIGAPPGTIRSPCQELADDRRPFRVQPSPKAGPGAEQTLPLARREAPARFRKSRDTIGLRLSARHPLRPRGKLS